MNTRHAVGTACVALGLACAAFGGSMQPAKAGPISLDTWYEFGFNDPVGPLFSGVGFAAVTDPPDGHPIVQVDDSPWTVSLSGPAKLTVLDLFISVDQFEMFDNAASLGLTSAPIPGSNCGGSITCSLGNLDFSRREYLLAAGNHSLTGVHTLGEVGAAVFQITAVPEPASLGLLGAALTAFGLLRRRKNRA